MSSKILCSPTFSEGREKEVIETLASAISAIDCVTLVDVDPSQSSNKTIFSFVGSPDAVVEAAVSVSRAALQLIDMTQYKSLQPSIGALTTCPFIPVRNATLEQCVLCAQQFAMKLSEDLNVPVYMYGAAATPGREQLAMELLLEDTSTLAEKIQKPEWTPDFGPAVLVPQLGASLVGARKFQVHYNVNLLATKEQAKRIASSLREKTSGAEQKPAGSRNHELQTCGWYSEEQNVAQVSTIITDFELIPIHQVFEDVVREAEALNLGVVGSQLVGVVPLAALMVTAQYYIEKENLFILEDDQKIRLVVQRLGLNSLGTFNPKERIIEFMLQDDSALGGGLVDGPLVSMSLRDFILTVSSRMVTPGGGSVAALQAALGCGLATMTGLLTYGERRFQSVDAEMRRLLPVFHRATRDFIPQVEDDALIKYEKAKINTLSPANEEESNIKGEMEKSVMSRSVDFPLSICRRIDSLWPMVVALAGSCNLEHRADLQTGIKCLQTAVWAAHFNLNDTLDQLADPEAKEKANAEMSALLKAANENSDLALTTLAERKAPEN